MGFVQSMAKKTGQHTLDMMTGKPIMQSMAKHDPVFGQYTQKLLDADKNLRGNIMGTNTPALAAPVSAINEINTPSIRKKQATAAPAGAGLAAKNLLG